MPGLTRPPGKAFKNATVWLRRVSSSERIAMPFSTPPAVMSFPWALTIRMRMSPTCPPGILALGLHEDADHSPALVVLREERLGWNRSGEVGERRVHRDVVREQDAARSQRSPARLELVPHVGLRMGAVVEEEVDRA